MMGKEDKSESAVANTFLETMSEMLREVYQRGRDEGIIDEQAVLQPKESKRKRKRDARCPYRVEHLAWWWSEGYRNGRMSFRAIFRNGAGAVKKETP